MIFRLPRWWRRQHGQTPEKLPERSSSGAAGLLALPPRECRTRGERASFENAAPLPPVLPASPQDPRVQEAGFTARLAAFRSVTEKPLVQLRRCYEEDDERQTVVRERENIVRREQCPPFHFFWPLPPLPPPGKESQLNENRGEGRAPPLGPFDVAARRIPLVDARGSRGDRFPRRRR
ncbi:hypothetical protein MTO96_030466 [Rhipicephalus appendiculatus]